MPDSSKLKAQSWVHFTAIGGKGMGALAGLLVDLGYMVTGSDGPIYPPMSGFLAQKKIPIKESYSAVNLEGKTWKLDKEYPDLVIVGNVISRGHPEATKVEELLESGKTQRMSFAQALAHFAIQGKESFVVSGTHGKSTSSSMLSWLAQAHDLNPGFFIGALPGNFSTSCRVSPGEIFISEGDEYDTAYWDKVSKFLHYLPDWVICTGIEFDHADIFKDLVAIEDSFLELVGKTKKGWVLVEKESAPVAKSVERVAKAVEEVGLRLLRYGFEDSSDWQIKDLQTKPLPATGQLMSALVISNPEGVEREFFSPMMGRHNALNLLSCIAVLVESGRCRWEDLKAQAVIDFKGLKKRQEELFCSAQKAVVDDFAHHPRAIYETLWALKEKYPARAICAFFEPRSATSARNLLFDDFVDAFADVDEVYLIEATKENVPMEERLRVADLAKMIESKHPKTKVMSAKSVDDLEALYQKQHQLNPKRKELLVVMSNGSFGGLAERLARAGDES